MTRLPLLTSLYQHGAAATRASPLGLTVVDVLLRSFPEPKSLRPELYTPCFDTLSSYFFLLVMEEERRVATLHSRSALFVLSIKGSQLAEPAHPGVERTHVIGDEKQTQSRRK